MINIKYKLSVLWYLEVFTRMYFLVYLIFIAWCLVYISIHIVAFIVYMLCIIIYVYWIKKEAEPYLLETEIQIVKDEIIRRNINWEIHINLNYQIKFFNSINFYILVTLDQVFIIPKKYLSSKDKEIFLEIVEKYNLNIENIKFFKFKMKNYSVKIWFYLLDSQGNIITKQFLENNDDFEKFNDMYIIPKSNMWLLKFVSLLNMTTQDSDYILWQNVFLSASLFLISENKIKSLFLTLQDMADIENRNKINWNKNWKIEIDYEKYFIKFKKSWNNIILETYGFTHKKKKRLLSKYLIKDSKKFIREIMENIECYMKIKNLILKQDMSTQLMLSIDPQWIPDILKQERNFVPLASVGPLKFGMGVNEVNQILKIRWEKFIENEFETAYTYNNRWMRLYYSNDNMLEFIQITDIVNLTYKKRGILKESFDKIDDFLEKEEQPLYNGKWYIFENLGLCFNEKKDGKKHLETIWCFRKWYYEKFRNQDI